MTMMIIIIVIITTTIVVTALNFQSSCCVNELYLESSHYTINNGAVFYILYCCNDRFQNFECTGGLTTPSHSTHQASGKQTKMSARRNPSTAGPQINLIQFAGLTRK